MTENCNRNRQKHKLLVTIVKKGLASKIVKASKKAGAQGGTIIFGRGTGVHEHASFFGIKIEPEKEVILTIVDVDTSDSVLAAIVQEGKLDKPGTGVGFILDTKQVAGIAHLLGLGLLAEETTENKEIDMSMDNEVKYDLIVTVVNKGMSDLVVDSSKKAGAEGGTIITGRGTGIHEKAKLFSIQIEPEKELVLTLIDHQKTEQVLNAILEGAELNKPGHGIAFVLPVDKTVGINHVMNRLVNEQLREEKAGGNR